MAGQGAGQHRDAGSQAVEYAAGQCGSVFTNVKMLLLVVNSHQHSNEFSSNLAVVLIEALQIRYQFDIGRFKTRYGAGLALALGLLGAAKAQPFRRNSQPLGNHAQLLLRWNSLAYEPFPGGMHGDGPAIEANVKFPREAGGTIW